jgi:hypothetical protein
MITAFLIQMEDLTWRQIWDQTTGGGRRGAKHKFIPIASCTAEAQNRLGALGLEEHSDNWFRFRLGGERRLWGVLLEGHFFIVWWDANHEVCPGRDR